MFRRFGWGSKTGLTRRVALLAGPLIFQQVSFTLLGVTDTFFVSRISTEAVAAVGLAGVLFFALMLLFRSTANSSVVFVGRAHGAKDDAALGKSVWHVLNTVLILSVLALSLPWLLSYLFGFAAPADSSEVLRLGSRYLQIRALEVPLAMFNALVWGFLVGRDDSRTPMLLAWLQVGINIVLDWLLVLGNLGLPELGVTGAAVATVLANLVVALVSAGILFRRPHRERYGLGRWRGSSPQDISGVLKIGLPMGLGDFSEVASFSMFFAIVGRLGTDILAANNIALQYMSLSFTLGIAVSMASSSLVAQFLGANEPQQAERVGYRATYLAMVLMGAVGLSYLIAPAALMRVFSAEASVIEAGVSILRLVALYQTIDAVAIVLGGSLNGAGDTTYTMFTRLVLAWGMFIPLTWLFAFPLEGGVRGAWVAALIYLFALGVAYFVRFRSGKWKTISLPTNAGAQPESVTV